MQEQSNFYERYNRQILLSGIGEEGQQTLSNASVLVIGAGGLGCPALQYMAAAGVGTIGIVDDDLVSLSNLHRQPLYTTADVGKQKAAMAAERLRALNPLVQVNAYPFRLTNQNALDVMRDYKIVLDATDNFATRYLVNDACVLLNKPFVYGAVSQFEGQVAVFNGATANQKAVNYRDLFPQPPTAGTVLSCAEAGVLGVLPGIIGTMQATEALKMIANIGEPLINRLLTYNALTHESFVFQLTSRNDTAASLPKDESDFMQRDYDWFCGTKDGVEEIDAASFHRFLQDKQALIVDVREKDEQPFVTEFNHIKLPLSGLKKSVPAIDQDTAVLFCQAGSRSREAAKLLTGKFGQAKKIYSLRGGILLWKQQHGKEA